jgi:VIT1/CCC1 family predicted Fe2+/Mn2+ transporter
MPKFHLALETHRSQHISWLRALVLGANDGIVSTASLILGVAAAHTSFDNILLTGVAGLVAGAMSMAAGEYVSVSSQADTEKADLAREKFELENQPEQELNELAHIYVERGLDFALAMEVAKKLTAHDALSSHARDELGINSTFSARPVQAALVSAVAFSVGAALPLILVVVSPVKFLTLSVALGSLFFLMILGALAAKVGGASIWRGALRVLFWGALAMLMTSGIGALFGTVV